MTRKQFKQPKAEPSGAASDHVSHYTIVISSEKLQTLPLLHLLTYSTIRRLPFQFLHSSLHNSYIWVPLLAALLASYPSSLAMATAGGMIAALLLLAAAASAQDCTSQTFSSSNTKYTLCTSLATQGATLHWTYHPENATADVAYRIPKTSSDWAGWGINPVAAAQMSQSNVFVAYFDSASKLTVITTVLGDNPQPLQDGSLPAFTVYSRSAEFTGGAYTIYSTISLPGNTTKPNVVWQSGSTFTNGVPSSHPLLPAVNLASTASLDLLNAQSIDYGDPRLTRKNTHGILNAISWGFLLPVGVMTARYMRMFESLDPAWFYLHIGCQVSGYILGVSGWGLGLQLGSETPGVEYQPHRSIGIALFCLATLQVFALFLRPDKKNKHRFFWNVYHHSVGYSVVILSIVNVFQGFDILHPASGWKNAYIAVIAALGGLALALEVATLVIRLRRRKQESEQVHQAAAAGAPPSGYAVDGDRPYPYRGA